MVFEDIAVGRRDAIGQHTFTESDIRRFAAVYDPQPFHLDAAAGGASAFGGLVASGWYVASVWMKLTVAFQPRLAEEARASGRPVGRAGPSPGFRDLVWARPVRPGDTLVYGTTVTGKRESASRPDWGILAIRGSASDGAGTEVFRFDGAVFWERLASATRQA